MIKDWRDKCEMTEILVQNLQSRIILKWVIQKSEDLGLIKLVHKGVQLGPFMNMIINIRVQQKKIIFDHLNNNYKPLMGYTCTTEVVNMLPRVRYYCVTLSLRGEKLISCVQTYSRRSLAYV